MPNLLLPLLGISPRAILQTALITVRKPEQGEPHPTSHNNSVSSLFLIPTLGLHWRNKFSPVALAELGFLRNEKSLTGATWAIQATWPLLKLKSCLFLPRITRKSLKEEFSWQCNCMSLFSASNSSTLDPSCAYCCGRKHSLTCKLIKFDPEVREKWM